jgi:hypothetical protein
VSVAHGWHHADPDMFWGRAIHYTRTLGAFVLLLDHVASAAGNFMQEGVYLSVNATSENPTARTKPAKIVCGGAWCPQVVGLDDGCGDAEVAKRVRSLMPGSSAWRIELETGPPECIKRPPRPTKAALVSLFNHVRRTPW